MLFPLKYFEFLFLICSEPNDTTDRDDKQLGNNNGSNYIKTNKSGSERDDNQNIDYKYKNDNATNLYSSKRPPKLRNYEKEEIGSPLTEKENEAAKVRSTETGMSHFGQISTAAKNQTCDRGVWSWQDERIFLQVLYSIMNSYNNSMNICYQGGMINIKSNNDGSEDVCSNNDGGLMQNNKEFDVCLLKSVERYGSFPKYQKQMYDTKNRTSEDKGDNTDSLCESQVYDDTKSRNNAIVALSGHSSDGGRDKTVSSGGGIKHGGQTNLSKVEIDEYELSFLTCTFFNLVFGVCRKIY